MAPQLTVTIEPPDRPDAMRVQDVFSQIIDLFHLASHTGASAGAVTWRLVEASMNSPFTVVAEAVPTRPDIADFEALARAQIDDFERNLDETSAGRIPAVWSHGEPRKRARSVFNRSRSTLGRTRVLRGRRIRREFIGGDAMEIGAATVMLEITPEAAERAVLAFGDSAHDLGVRVKDQIGTVEGSMISVGTHYNRPAVLVRDRRSKAEYWVTIPDEFRQEISRDANFEDVWSGRRVLLNGMISYSDDGSIARMSATHVRPIGARSVSLSDIQDPDFTSGMSATEYIDALWDGKLGRGS